MYPIIQHGRTCRAASLAGCWLFAASQAMAHGTGAPGAAKPWTTWSSEPKVVLPIVALGWLYGVGWLRLHYRNRVVKRSRELMFFLAGWLSLVIALISPIHPLGGELFFVHMVQHELLMIVAAPLLVLSRFELFLTCVLPAPAASSVAKGMRRSGIAAFWRCLNHPIAAWVIHAFFLWAWHVPRWFDATLSNEWVHAAQHISFFSTAVLFWEAVLHSTHRRAAYGASVLYLFTTAAHTGALGALLAFSTHVWYPAYGSLPTEWGFTPLEDQQLGGLIMWVPAGLIYIAAGLVLFASWLKESERLSDTQGYADRARLPGGPHCTSKHDCGEERLADFSRGKHREPS